MLFNSYIFIAVFLPTTLLCYYLLRARVGGEASFVLLCLASLVYYGYWKVSYLPILIASILGNYYLGMILSKLEDGATKRHTLVFGVLANLAALGYYKYANFFVENLEAVFGLSLPHPNIVLPLAISFFTFQQIAYLVDAYRGEVREYRFIHYCLFVTFFPQLIAGPIVHHKEMLPQFMDRARGVFDSQLFWLGVVQFSMGLFKKVVIADNLALYASPVFGAADQGASLSMTEAWVGSLAYTFQLYFDFSGYSDMALGIGRMFGINLPINFNSPYKSLSISDFWRRWHMTLSRFLRDYLYIALGGNRRGQVRRYVNLFLTMLLGGLWHGASWNFVVWGALHGGYLVVNHAWSHGRKRLGLDGSAGRAYQLFAWTVTFLAVVVAWVVFRAETFGGALRIYSAALDVGSFSATSLFAAELGVLSSPAQGLALIVASALLAFFGPNAQDLLGFPDPAAGETGMQREPSARLKLVLSIFTPLLLVLSIASMNQISEFLYFQF